LPAGVAELDTFDAQIRAAKSFGAELGRVVILPGRRYEQFASFAEFKRAEAEGLERLRHAERVAARHQFRLAVENHKDQLVAEKLAILRQVDSEYVGICVDVGNNFPLLEDPVDTARAFAPWALTVHIKDQAVRPAPNGFLLADVPLGQGCLDLSPIVDLLRAAKPTLHFNYETITRDPLLVPVLTDAFWATLPDAPAHALARLMAIVKHRSASQPFPAVSQLSAADQLRLELEGIQSSLEFARAQLAL
jgi:sugar phosphate isomerase/epimerase